MAHESVVVAIVSASYAAILAGGGFLVRGMLRSRHDAAARVDKLRRRVRKLRGRVRELRGDVEAIGRVAAQLEQLRIKVRELRAGAETGTRAAAQLEQLRQDVAVIASEIEALQSWQAAQQRRTGDPRQ